MNAEQRTATTSAEALYGVVHSRDAWQRIPYTLTVIRDKYSLLCKQIHKKKKF